MAAAHKVFRYLVTGRVQGVSFRAATRLRADELGLHGWVRNLHDGSVEVVAGGDAESLSAFARWLWEGPPGAKVASVAAAESAEALEPDFEIR